MRKVLFSFLGTGKYDPCIYTYNGKSSTETRFIQTAIYEHLSDDNLEVVIFVTSKAKKTNWEDGIGENGEHIEGLRSTLARKLPQMKVKLVEISDSQNEVANWELFDKILEEIQDGDEIYFDITHSYRSIPIVALIVLNYARLVKNAKIKKLVYGLYDKNQVIKEFPIVDMTNMLSLLDWTNGVDQFIRTGDASLINEITNKEVKQLQESEKVSDEDQEDIKTLNQLANQLEVVGKTFQTCRTLNVTEEVRKLGESLDKVGNISTEYLKPLQPLAKKIDEKYKVFGQSETINGLIAAKWCEEHGLIQPGLTLLQENVVTTICQFVDLNKKNFGHRKCVSSAINILNKNLEYAEAEWQVPPNKKDIVREIINKIKSYKELLTSYSLLTHYRNDINHGGTDKSTKHDVFLDELKQCIQDLTRFFEEMDKLIAEKQMLKLKQHFEKLTSR